MAGVAFPLLTDEPESEGNKTNATMYILCFHAQNVSIILLSPYFNHLNKLKELSFQLCLSIGN